MQCNLGHQFLGIFLKPAWVMMLAKKQNTGLNTGLQQIFGITQHNKALALASCSILPRTLMHVFWGLVLRHCFQFRAKERGAKKEKSGSFTFKKLRIITWVCCWNNPSRLMSQVTLHDSITLKMMTVCRCKETANKSCFMLTWAYILPFHFSRLQGRLWCNK